MKVNTTKKIIMVVFCFFYFCPVCYSQRINLTATQWLEFHKKQMDTTKFIFEGIVTHQECYYAKNKEILICSVMQITKIFKGSPQIKLGSIKVITLQSGHIGDKYAQVPIDGGGIELSKGSTYIILGRQAYSYMLADIIATTDNTIILTTMDCDDPIVISGKGKVQWYGVSKFKTKDDIYNFFKENGLTVQEEVQPAVPRDSVKH